MRWWQRKNEFNCCRGIADSTKLQDRAISWPPENLLIELLTGIVTTVNVNTINQEQSTLQSHLKELFLAVVRFSPPHD